MATGTLYIIATPIGNLGDITFRALEVFKSVDFILCEDTRVTQKLLNYYDIKKPLLRYNEHADSAPSRRRREGAEVSYILNLLEQDKNLALVSDAGTPGISDPGGKLIEYVGDRIPHIKIVPIPGPSALACAVSIAGFAMNKFLFLGFPPVKKKRKKFFEEFGNSKYPIILYESSHRILKTLGELAEFTGAERKIVLCRELTKKFETIHRGTIAEVLDTLHDGEIRGEFVIIISK